MSEECSYRNSDCTRYFRYDILPPVTSQLVVQSRYRICSGPLRAPTLRFSDCRLTSSSVSACRVISSLPFHLLQGSLQSAADHQILGTLSRKLVSLCWTLNSQPCCRAKEPPSLNYTEAKVDVTQEIEQRAQQAAQAGADHCALSFISCVTSTLASVYSPDSSLCHIMIFPT